MTRRPFTIHDQQVFADPVTFNPTLLNLLRATLLDSKVDFEDGSIVEQAGYMPTGSGSLGMAFVWIVMRGKPKTLHRVLVEEENGEFVLRMRRGIV
jgi:hypothetical protein